MKLTLTINMKIFHLRLLIFATFFVLKSITMTEFVLIYNKLCLLILIKGGTKM